jgi:hypothetical protein
MKDSHHKTNPPAPKEGGYICARCAVKGKTCCQLAQVNREQEADVCFPVSAAEQQRIETCIQNLPEKPRTFETPEAAKLTRLFAPAMNDKKFYLAMLKLFPGEGGTLQKLYPAKEKHLQMNLHKDGSCICLSTSGCILPTHVRPWYCRLFPFWVIKKRLLLFTPGSCLAVTEYKNMTGMMQTFATDQNSVFELYAGLRREWGLCQL